MDRNGKGKVEDFSVRGGGEVVKESIKTRRINRKNKVRLLTQINARVRHHETHTHISISC